MLGTPASANEGVELERMTSWIAKPTKLEAIHEDP
jgi:hypothetical protein